MNNRVMSLLGIARRAGKLAMGNDMVNDCIKNGESRLILLASDISPRTAKNIEFIANEYEVKVMYLNESMDEIGVAIGKRIGIVSVNDAGFAKKVCSLMVNN